MNFSCRIKVEKKMKTNKQTIKTNKEKLQLVNKVIVNNKIMIKIVSIIH